MPQWRSWVLITLITFAACSAAPTNPVGRHRWQGYERALIRLEAEGDHAGRRTLIAEGLADPMLGPDARARLLIERARVHGEDRHAALLDLDAACDLARLDDTRQRAALTRLAIDPSEAARRSFLARFPASPHAHTVLVDLVRAAPPERRLALLLDLSRACLDRSLRCHVLLRAGALARDERPALALEIFDTVGAADCSRAADARLSAGRLLAAQGRWGDLRARQSDEQQESVAWALCRLLDGAPEPEQEGLVCLARFAERFPGSRHVDDAWFWLAERYHATGHTARAVALFEKIIHERPDSGRAAYAQRRLQALRPDAGPPGD